MSDIARDHSRDDSPPIADGPADVVHAEEEERSSSSVPANRGKRILKRIGLTLLVLVVLVAALALVAYNFGSMEPPSAEARSQYAALVSAGKVPPAPAGGFHVPIPGCRCHSNDPVLQVQHESIPIKDCSRCHGGGAAPAQ